MSYGHARNTGIPYVRNYNEALALFNKAKPIKGTGANGGKIPLGHRHRVSEFYIEKVQGTEKIECYCYRTPVVTFHPDGNIELISGGWSSPTTAYFLEDILPITCRIKDSSLVVRLSSGEYKFRGDGLIIKYADGQLVPTNVKPDYVYRVKRKESNIVRKNYAEFTKYFMGMVKVREGGMAKYEEYINVFGKDDKFTQDPRPNLPNDVALRKPEEVESIFAMMQSDDYDMRYKAMLLIMKQFGKRHYWKENGYSITTAGVKMAMSNLIFARHKEEVFELVEVPLGTIKEDSWSHLF